VAEAWQEGVMTTLDEVNEPARQFLARLFEQAGGQASRQLSMYDIGKGLGWEREAASQAAQDLMAAGLVEIRTLSGGIGLSADGVDAVRASLGPREAAPTLPRLGAGRILDAAASHAVVQVCDGIKVQAGSLGLDFDSLAELVADLKTVADQLGSPRPKTAVVRASLRSIEGVLQRCEGNKHLADVRALIAE
jgi:hypothetical protein